MRKLLWHQHGGSDRHPEVIRVMLRVSGDTVDRGALDMWIGRLGLAAEWERVAGVQADNENP